MQIYTGIWGGGARKITLRGFWISHEVIRNEYRTDYRKQKQYR